MHHRVEVHGHLLFPIGSHILVQVEGKGSKSFRSSAELLIKIIVLDDLLLESTVKVHEDLQDECYGLLDKCRNDSANIHNDI